MNCRERVLRAIKFEKPDRIPFTYSIMPSALMKYGQAFIDLCTSYPNDFYDPAAVLKIPKRDTANYQPDGTYYKEWTDEWGSVWVYYREGISGEVKRPVLDDWSKLKSFKCPPVHGTSPEERRKSKDSMARMKEEYVGWGGGGSLFEQMQWLRGPENLFIDIAEDRDEVYQLADLIVEQRLLPTIELSLAAGADVIGFGDDWGTQQKLLIHPESFRKIFKPRYKRMFDLTHQGGALPWMHSDGMTLEIMEDWIEIGLSVVNPQFSCTDIEALHKVTDHRLCIAGDIDRQWLLPAGTPEQIHEYLRNVTRIFGSPDGGFVYSLGIEDTPIESAEAAFAAIREFCPLA